MPGALQRLVRNKRKNTALLMQFFAGSGPFNEQNIDYYSEANFSAQQSMYLGYVEKIGQSITGNGFPLTSAKFYMNKTGSPTGDVTAELYAHSGTFGQTSVGTGSVLATSDSIDASVISTSYGLITFTFSTPYNLVNGEYYILAVCYSGGDALNLVRAGLDSSSPSHVGNYCYYSGGGWTASSVKDVIFYAISG